MARTAVSQRLTWQTGTVVETRPESRRARSLVLAVDGWTGHRTGQHVDIRLTAEDGYQAVRSYSIASAPASDRLEILVEEVEGGEVSPYLVEEARAGDRMEVRGPIGGYFTWTADMREPLLLIAGGSGIAPIMSMVRQRAATGSDVPVRLIYSMRSPETVIFEDELERMAAADTRLDLILTYTRSHPPDWTGYRRRVDAELLNDVAWPAADGAAAYVCGPTPFVESVATDLVAMGYPSNRIRTERFGPTGA